MILTGNAIERAISYNQIEIEPFNKANIGANSYDLTLAPILKVYSKPADIPLDLKTISNESMREIEIPDTGFVLEPGELYLGSTIERTFTDCFVPMIETRSSMARAGFSSHISAGFGDIGFNGKWTLEITVIRPLRIYPNIRVAQIFFEEPKGLIQKTYNGRYQNQNGVVQSRFNTNLEEGKNA